MTRRKRLLNRRKELFMQLEPHLRKLIHDHPEEVLYILDLWKYIADAHREELTVEIEK